MASKMAARNKCKELLCKNWCTDSMYIIHQINDIYFCSVCLNFLMIHLNMVSMSRSRSNSRLNTQNSEKWLISLLSFAIVPKFT